MRHFNTPVLFLVFNRPDTTRQVFEAIRQARPPKLYVAADGPRKSRSGEADRVAEVRKIATAVDWPCEVRTLFREENLGCKMAVSGAIDWFFENEEMGIILEDDCLPSQSFFRFCEHYLNFFKNDFSIFSISGNLRQFVEFNLPNSASICQSKYFNMWGWATWKRAWMYYNIDIFLYCQFSNEFYHSLNMSKDVSRYWKNVAKMMTRGSRSIWDYQFIFISFIMNTNHIYPTVNMVQNIGFGKNATHTFDSDSILASNKAKEFNFIKNEINNSDLYSIDSMLEYEYTTPSFVKRLKKKFLQIFLNN